MYSLPSKIIKKYASRRRITGARAERFMQAMACGIGLLPCRPITTRERERAGDPAACLLSELARACWRIEVRDAWNCRRERGDFLWLQLQQGSGLSLLSLVSYPVLCLGMLLYGSCSNKKSSSLSLAPNNSVIVTDVSRAGWGSPDRARARLELNPALTRRAAA
jgi:hypothetical protein